MLMKGLWATALVAGAAGADKLNFEELDADLLPFMATQGRTMDAEIVDLEGDGLADIVLASEFGFNVVLMADLRGGWELAARALPGGHAHDSEDIAAFDADGDGTLDLVFVAEDDETNELYLNKGDGWCDDASDRLPVSGVSNAVLAIDLDADGDEDLIIGNKGQNVALLNDGEGRFTEATSERLPERTDTTQDLEAGDVDGDGDLDLFVANEDGNRLLINDGRGVFADESEARLPDIGGVETREADFGDVDGDGDLDVVLANVAWVPGANPQNRVLLNDGEGVFEDGTSDWLPEEKRFSLDVELVDLDDDGDLDLLIANVQGGPLQVMLNIAGRRFEDVSGLVLPELTRPVHAIDVEAGDLNGDGALDLYVANHVGPDWVLLGGGG